LVSVFVLIARKSSSLPVIFEILMTDCIFVFPVLCGLGKITIADSIRPGQVGKFCLPFLAASRAGTVTAPPR